jgi:AbrB family looped-hinge helix DNA binding protein
MTIAQSKVTAQGQISVPAEVRKKLGVGPGSLLEWAEQNDQVVVRRAGRYTSAPQEIARKAGHSPVGTFDRDLSKLEDTVRLHS